MGSSTNADIVGYRNITTNPADTTTAVKGPASDRTTAHEEGFNSVLGAMSGNVVERAVRAALAHGGDASALSTISHPQQDSSAFFDHAATGIKAGMMRSTRAIQGDIASLVARNGGLGGDVGKALGQLIQDAGKLGTNASSTNHPTTAKAAVAELDKLLDDTDNVRKAIMAQTGGLNGSKDALLSLLKDQVSLTHQFALQAGMPLPPEQGAVPVTEAATFKKRSVLPL